MRILACMHDLEFMKELMSKIRHYPNAVLIAVSALPSDINLIDALDIDVCLFDYEQNRDSAFSCAYYINHLSYNDVHFLFLLNDSHGTYTKMMNMRPETMTFICAPYTADDVLNKLMIIKTKQHGRASFPDYDSCVSKIIQNLGIPIHLKGYRFIKSGAIIIYNRGGQLLSMVQLYREIARIHKTTASRVEKAIRDAIEYAYRKTKDRISVDGYKPTNSQLIYFVYEHLAAELKKCKGSLTIGD